MSPLDEVDHPRVTRTSREIGHAGGHTPGPLLVCVAGQHGNEPSGVVALERVFCKLEELTLSLRGELVGLAGNLPALHANERYLAKDLNRLWQWERAERLELGEAIEDTPEDHELNELLRAMNSYLNAGGDRGVVIFDLHTASAPSAPFLILGDTLKNREFARRFPLPIVLGLEEQLDGTLSEYGTGLGHISVAFEAGHHTDPAAVRFHEAAVWLMLAHSGALLPEEVPDFQRHERVLRAGGRGVPKLLEIMYRHPVAPEDGFEMRPGFRNFAPVEEGALLASDRRGEIRAPSRFRIFLPRYQGLGEDGFFLARPVNRIWLKASTVMRHLGLRRFAPYLPGVSKHSVLKNALIVDPRVARFFVRELFHLLGYRMMTPEDGKVVVRRRRGD